MAFFRRRPEPKIEMDEAGIRKQVAGRDLENVRWDELVSLEVRAKAVHPSGVLPVWIMTDRSGDQLSVSFAEEPDGFLARVQMLPGFQEEQFMASMNSMSDATFACWRASTS